MKKNILILSLVSTAFVVCIYLYSCKRSNKGEEIPKTSFDLASLQVNNQFSITTNNILGWEEKFEPISFRYTKFDANDHYLLFNNALSSPNIKDICKQITSIDIAPHTLVLYLETPLDTNNSNLILGKNSVSAISFYVPVNGKLFHKLFIKKDNVFIEKKEYTFEANLASSTHMLFLLKYILPEEVNVKSFLCIRNNEMKFIRSSEKDLFTLKFAGFIQNFIKENKNLKRIPLLMAAAPPSGGGEATGCGTETGCTSGATSEQCVFGPDNTYSCKPAVCLLGIIKTFIEVNELLAENEIATIFDLDVCYNLRNNFLLPSYLGYKYIEDYYAISVVVDGNVTSGLALDVAAALPELFTIISKLLNPTGHEYDILIGDTYYTDLSNIIDALSGISVDATYQAILSDLQNDLDWYHGKTLATISALF